MNQQPKLPDFVTVGAGTYFADLLFHRWANERIRIGSYCSISRQVRLLAGGNHKTDAVTTFPIDTMLLGKQGGTLSDRSYDHRSALEVNGIHIGSDVWIGWGASIIGSNITIGHGAVIAAGAVVLTSIPPYAIATGNVARVTRYRFREEIVEALLQIRWWDWDAEKIKRNADWFYKPVEEFVEKFGVGVKERRACV